MNEKYLQDLYGWIKGQDPSYEGRYTYDQFKQRMQDETYATQMHGWISSKDETFSQRRPLTSFVQQVKVVSPMATKPVAEQPKKKEDTVSPFVAGGSELTKFDPRTGQVVQETPSFTKPGAVKPQAPQQPKPTETIMYGPMGAMGLQRTKEYKPEYEGKSIPKVVGELGKTLTKGVVKFPADVLETAAIATAAARNLAAKTGLVDETTATQVSLPTLGAGVNFFQAASEWKNLVNEFIPTDKDIESGFWGQTATALGQMVPVILTGGISGGGRAIAKEAGKKGLSMQAVANYGKEVVSRMGSAQGLLTVSQVSAPSYQQAKLEGATENEAIGFALQNAVMTYPLEMLPVNNLFKRLDNVLVGNKGVEVLKRAVVGGAEEGITEGLQNIYENVTADAIYGTTKEILDGVGESTAVGGTVGAIMNGLLTALLGRRARATSETEIEQLDKSIEDVQQKVNQVESNNKAIEKTINEIEETTPRKLSYGSADYNFLESKNGDLEYADDALTEEQAQGVVNNLASSYKKIDFTIEEVEPESPYQPTTYKIIGKPKTIQQDAIQEQAAGQVPVQPGTGVGQEVAQGEPQAEPQGVTQEGQEKIADIERRRQEELSNLGQKQFTSGFNKLTEAKTPEQAAKAIKEIEQNVSQGAKLSSEQSKQLSDAKEQLKNDGYEIIESPTYRQGENKIVQSSKEYDGEVLTEQQVKEIESSINSREERGLEVNVEDLPSPVTRVVKPQLNKDGKMIQSAEVNTIVFDSVEQAKNAIRKSKEAGYKQFKASDKINAKYDAEIAAIQPQKGQVQEEVAPTQQPDIDGEVSLLEQLLAQEETAPTQSAGISVSSEADVNDLRNRTQSRSQQATTKEEKESANTRVKIIDTAKKAINTLKSVFPDVDIVIHDDEGSYNAAMSEIDGVAGSRGNFFIDTTPDGKTTGRIDINLSKANSRTVAHEIAHGILLKTFGDNKNLFNDFRTRISKVLKGDVNQQLNDFANQYVDPVTGELLDVNHEEFLAELTGILEQQEANVSITTIQKVAALINEFVSKITGGKFKPFEDTKNTKDVVDFFNTISSAIREGQSLEGVTEKINPNAEPTGTKVDTSSLKKRSSLIEKLGLERFSDMNQRITEGVTLNSLGDVISHLTFSDRLVTGRVGNKDYLGGILFAAATNRVWASFTKGRVSQIISGMPKNEDGYRYLMPALLTEGAHMSNKDMSNTAIKLIEDAISNGDISPVDADSRIRKALNRKGLESLSKLYSDTIGENKLTPDLVISAIDNAIVKSNSTFEDRNTFLESLLGKADIDLKKRFGTLPSYNVLANGLAEPITNRHEFGDILLVIRTKGDLVAVQPKEGDPDYHPSYPWVIRSVNPDGSIADVETLIFDQSYNAVNVFPEVTNKQGQKFTYQQYVDKYGDGAKSRYLGYMGARSAMSTSVTEKIATEAQPKSKVISRSQINDALSKASGTTQVATTTGSYVKAANILKNSGVEGDILDYGAGLGLGSDAMSDVLGKTVDSLEVNPERWKGKTPVKYTDANQIDKKYDGIVSLNVVNVVPKSIRDFIIKDIFNNLKDGGTAIISSRGFKGDIDQAKNFVPGPEEKSYIIKRKQDGEIIDVFQKGYDGNELVEYVQDLLGDSAEVVSNNTFGNKGVIIKKSSGVKSRAQLAGNDAQRIVNLGRANGLSEQAISTVLQKRGFTQDAIDAALGKVEPAAKKVEVTEEFAPGYNRVLNEIFGIIAKSRERNRPEEGTLKNAINYLGKTKVYENATDVQREAMVRNLRKEFNKREKAAPSAEKVVGKPKKKQVTVDEMAALKDQIKLEARAAREAKGDLNTKRKALAARIIAARRKGTITAVQARALVNRISKVNLDNPIMVDRLLEYTDKVFDDANYAADMAELRKLQKQARSRNHTSMTNVVNQFTSINPEDIPLDRIQDYKEALDFLNTRTPFYGKMNEVFDEMLSYKVAEKFDAVKTKDALMDKYKSIMANEVKTVEDYVALIKDLNAFKRKAFQLLQNDAITQEEYDDLINGAGETQAVIEKKFASQITKIKKDLIAEIKKQRPRVSREFSKEENDLIRKYLELSDADLESLSPEDLFILNDLLDNISNGEIDNFRFNEIISKAYTSDGANRLAKQIDDSKFDMTPEEGMKELSEYESSFWEGLLGMGRAKSGALQKFVVSVFNRAIASYENLTRDGYNEFSKLKNKYKMSDKDMHKLGILTTYLQEYMAQFDPKNEGIKDIGKRDWFKEILSSKSMRSKYSSGKPSILKVIGLGKSEIDIIEEIWNSLPKDKDGNVDPKAVYDSYMANDGKFFTKNEKGFFDDVMAYKTSEITPKQKFANEINGASFKEIPFHMMRVRLDGGKTQITPTASSDNGVVRIKAGTGKERVSEAVGPIMTNFEKLFIKNLEQTGRDYFLSGALKDINNTLSGAKKKINPDKMPLLDTISGALSEALGYEFDRTQSNFIFRNLLSARAAITLLRPIRTVAELGSTLLSYPVRAKTLSGYKSLFGEQGAMKKLLEFTNSPMLLRDNINKAIDINDGRIEPQSRFTKATNYLSGLPERTMMITSWMPTFKSEFKNITGIDFDINKFNNSEAYREKYGKAIRESSAAADAQTEKIIGPTTKAGQRREVRIAPKVLANIIGLEGTVSKNTAAGQILGFFSNYPYREVTEFINGFKEAAEVIKDEGALSSLSQLQKPLGIALNVAAYGFLGTLTYAGQLILLGDEDDEERGIKMLKDIMTTEGLLNELASNAISLAGSKYAAGGKALLQLAATIAIESTDDEEQKAKIKKLLKDSVFVDPLPVEQAAKFGGRDKALSAIAMYIPQFVIFADRYADFIGGINEFEAIYDKVESKGVESLTQDEGTKILALNTIINASQILLNVFGGTSLPEYNNIKTYMNKLKEEAGVADVYKGEEPAKKKSSGGGGGSRGGGMNKTDLKRYNRELYDQLYGEGSATYEIEQEVKAFEKEQREYKKKIKDQVYGD